MSNPVQKHYQQYPYPHYPLIASVQRCDTYALNLDALWIRFNRNLPPPEVRNILIAGCGTFSPYPFSIANPNATITALDLSERSLKRASLHCLLHGRRNIVFRCGDLLDDVSIAGAYGLIDSYGVLHHLDDPLAGLKILAKHLIPDGIIRIMLYSRYARREEEAIRHALRMLEIRTPIEARKFLKKARPGSRLARYLEMGDEIRTESGIADALLHPRVHTYRVDELLNMIAQAGLQPLLFAHPGAKENVQEEIDRLRMLEKEYCSTGNFILYLGRDTVNRPEKRTDSWLVLNPCLTYLVKRINLGSVQIPARIGYENPLLGREERNFLRQFIRPVNSDKLSTDSRDAVKNYKRQLFLLEYDTW